MMNLNKTITRYENELLESVVPFWEKNCIDREYGECYAYLNRRGEPTHHHKGGKWKTFFHVPRYLLMCIEQIKKIKE